MDKRILRSLLIIGVAVLLIGGVTMAWFTSETSPINNKFETGTVQVGMTEEFIAPENWAPGEKISKNIIIENEGTLESYIRVKLEPLWEDGFSTDNVKISDSTEDSNWVKKNGYYYYKDIVAAGDTVPMNLTIELDGAKTGNIYQGKEFTLSVTAYSVQADEGAMSDEWSVSKTEIGIK